MTSERMPMAKALNLALHDALAGDPKVLLMGEDIGKLGGVFRVTDRLIDDFGPERVIDSPLAESGIVGTGIGLAMHGFKPVLEIQFDGFIFPAFNQITTQLAKLHSRSHGRLTMSVVIRVAYAAPIGAVEHHSESIESYFAHTAGLRVISPSTPQDAYTMLREAIECPDPVLFLEPKARYWDKGEVEREVPRSNEDLNRGRIAKIGSDLTLAAYGPSVALALQAAKSAASEGLNLEVLDLRTISPLDMDLLKASLAKTGRLVVVHQASTFFGAGAEIAARVSEECFYQLQSPVLRVGGFHMPYPPAKLEQEYLPDLDRVLDAVDRAMAY